MWWFTQGLCFLPAFLVVWSSSTFIISYIIALFRHDVDIIFPYISDTGANPPESCVFGLMTFISACAGVGTIYARYKFVEKLNEETRVVKTCLNKAALVFGMISCFGMCVVATFQETTVTVAHDVGAMMFFISGILYIIFQSWISYQAFPFGSSINVCRARVIIATLATLAFFPIAALHHMLIAASIFLFQDYPFHLASAVCEWIVAFSFICFFLTYIHDFKLFTLRVRTVYEE
ncbi:hypothetical protein L3Q82_000532 [Scortum barcoo]|uniref:Uncharacterized protein n=1 Tax=Scortum barcoo TaxID=214431 RepID=A0ACB8WFJ6_9TELE|nr:hypothetical protein L3Q82_000532 [Scortum barcoo]